MQRSSLYIHAVAGLFTTPYHLAQEDVALEADTGAVKGNSSWILHSHKFNWQYFPSREEKWQVR